MEMIEVKCRGLWGRNSSYVGVLEFAPLRGGGACMGVLEALGLEHVTDGPG